MIPAGVRVFVASQPVDFHRGPDGLAVLVRDAGGARLFRMRGNYWNDGDLDRVAEVLPVAPITVTEPIDLRDFFRDLRD